mgnify:CR=1 FL=1
MNAFDVCQTRSILSHSFLYQIILPLSDDLWSSKMCKRIRNLWIFKDVIFLRFSTKQRICVQFFPVPRIIAHQRLTFYYAHFNFWQRIRKGFQQFQAKVILFWEMKIAILSFMKFGLQIWNHYLTFQHCRKSVTAILSILTELKTYSSFRISN